jgi:hypothetical protein
VERRKKVSDEESKYPDLGAGFHGLAVYDTGRPSVLCFQQID